MAYAMTERVINHQQHKRANRFCTPITSALHTTIVKIYSILTLSVKTYGFDSSPKGRAKFVCSSPLSQSLRF